MNNKNVLLLKTLLRSTSSLNVLKTSKDGKKKGKIIGTFIAYIVLYLMLLTYSVLMAMGYGKVGLTDAMPMLLTMILTALAFMLTILKSNSYLYGFKEYDMLMAMPFTEKTVVGSKFMYMYLKSLPWYLTMSIAMLIGYAMYAKPAIAVYPIWIVLSMFIPVIPMLVASLLSFVVAKISAAFKYWKAVQAILLFAVIILSFFSRFFIEKIIKDDSVDEILQGTASFTESFEKIYLPAGWFREGATELKISSILLLIGVSVLLFELVFVIIARSYKRLNSAMKTSVARHAYKLTKQKKNSAAKSMAFKEIKRFTGSIPYLTNAGAGYVMAVGVGIAALFVGLDKIIGTVTTGAPVTGDMVKAAIPFIAYFLTGMMALTCSSPSLEGKNYWIIKSLPISYKDIYLGKILANLYISIPAQIIATLGLCIGGKCGIIETVGYILLGIVLCVFSATFGCECGIRFMKLDWENDVEVVKQGTAVVVYMFPNMILTMIMLVGGAILSALIGKVFVVVTAMLIYGLLTAVCMMRVMALAKRR